MMSVLSQDEFKLYYVIEFSGTYTVFDLSLDFTSQIYVY